MYSTPYKTSSQNRCRICLDTGDIPIFGNAITADPDISGDIEVFGDIELRLDDDFPKKLCKVCQQMLQAAVLFRKIAQKSDRFLKYIKSKRYKKQSSKMFKQEHFPEATIETEGMGDINECDEESSSHVTSKCNSPLEFITQNATSDSETDNIDNVTSGDDMMLIIVTNENEDDFDIKTYNCSICNTQYKSLDDYEQHYNKEHNDNINVNNPNPQKKQCPVCNKMFRKHYYDYHLATHDKSLRNYVCEKCGKSFIQPTALKLHSLTHGTDLPYKCQFCPYRGRHFGLLKVHVRTHTGDYAYKCTECPSRFITKSNLNIHLQRHKGPVDFICEICDKGFYSKLQLERHHKVDHLDIKEHVCDICGLTFGYKNNLLGHQVKVHKRQKVTTLGRIPTYKQVT